MSWLKSLFSSNKKPPPLSDTDINAIIGRHAQITGTSLMADLPAGETDYLSYYMKQIKASPADYFEARLLVWLAREQHVRPVFSTGTNAGFWIFNTRSGRVDLGIVGPGKNTMATGMNPNIAWLMRIEQSKPARFIEDMKLQFLADNPVTRQLGSGRIRVQFSAPGLRPEGTLGRFVAGR